MSKAIPIAIPITNAIESLRQHITSNLNKISLRLAQTDKRTSAMSMGFQRLTDVPDPSNATDAVNLRTLKKELQGVGNKHQQKQIPVTGYFTVVWANQGTSTAGVGIIPPYIFNPHRLGVPGDVKIYAIGTGTGSTTVNILYFPGGTGTGTKLLSSDLNLPLATKGPVTSTNFAILPSFQVNDVIYPIITTSGGISVFSIELLVNP